MAPTANMSAGLPCGSSRIISGAENAVKGIGRGGGVLLTVNSMQSKPDLERVRWGGGVVAWRGAPGRASVL